MRRAEVIRLLEEHQAESLGFGISSIPLFGSVARDDARADSDVDILVEFPEPPTFDQYMGLKLFLEDLLGCPVDLITTRSLDRRIWPAVESEAIRVA